MIDLARAAEQWRTEGWVLVEGLVPADDIAAARSEVPDRDVDPPLGRGPLRRPDADGPTRPDEPAFREEQFSGTVLFPVPAAPAINRLFVHPSLIAFAELALGSTDLRIYQSRIWSKYGDRANYEQPLHRDTNHSLVPTRSRLGWWFLECFLYLTDVDEVTGAPRLVPRSASSDEPSARQPVELADQPALYEAEVSAPGRAGSLLAYRADVWHRGTDIAEGAERHVLVVAFKPSGLDWVGFDAHPPLINDPDFVAFARGRTPRELALFGVPLPGHPFWTHDAIESMAEMYPGLDLGPWRDALVGPPSDGPDL